MKTNLKNICKLFLKIGVIALFNTIDGANADSINASNIKMPMKTASDSVISSSPAKTPHATIHKTTFATNVVVEIKCYAQSPCAVVKDTSEQVLKIINKNISTKKATYLIQQIVVPQFDFTLMTKYMLGNNWNSATPNQQKQIVNLFMQLLIYTYSTALLKFKGAQIIVTNEYIDKKKATIISQVNLPDAADGRPVKIEYYLAKTGINHAWKAYDIKIEDVSLVITYRNQLNDIIKSSQVCGLIKQLRMKLTSVQSLNS